MNKVASNDNDPPHIHFLRVLNVNLQNPSEILHNRITTVLAIDMMFRTNIARQKKYVVYEIIMIIV